MLWQEDSETIRFTVPDDIVDIAFKIECKTLPIDHAATLKQLLSEKLPWIDHEPDVGIHSIHGATSGNGWTRPDQDQDEIIHLSRRSRFYLRVPKDRLQDAITLVGNRLNIDSHSLTIRDYNIKPLNVSSTIFCRSLCWMNDSVEDELQLSESLVSHLAEQGITVTKMMFGKLHKIKNGSELIHARSVMIADLSKEDSIYLQQHGLGPNRLLGCGIFIPHKSISAVGNSQDDD